MKTSTRIRRNGSARRAPTQAATKPESASAEAVSAKLTVVTQDGQTHEIVLPPASFAEMQSASRRCGVASFPEFVKVALREKLAREAAEPLAGPYAFQVRNPKGEVIVECGIVELSAASFKRLRAAIAVMWAKVSRMPAATGEQLSAA